jgi:hypothetical protein
VRSDSEARAKQQDLFRNFEDCGIDRSLGGEAGSKGAGKITPRDASSTNGRDSTAGLPAFVE